MEKPALNVSKEGDGFILTDAEGRRRDLVELALTVTKP
jgi:hypothetical protein